MGGDPLVSVVMPVYNGGRFLDAAVKSILAQSFESFEFIIVDDGSTDSTPQILAEHARRDSRVIVIRQTSNLGVIAALNTGCNSARGLYIARMDADDVSESDRLQREVDFLSRNAHVGVVGTAVQVVDQDDRPVRVARYPVDPILASWSMFFFNSVVHPSVMMRRSDLESVGGYPTQWRHIEDYAVFLKLIRRTNVANLPDVLLRYRVWQGNVTTRTRDEQEARAAQALRDALADLTGLPVTEDQASGLRGLATGRYPRTTEQVRPLVALVRALLTGYITARHLGPEDARIATRAAALRLWQLAALAAPRAPRLALSVAARATALRPQSPLEFGRQALGWLGRR